MGGSVKVGDEPFYFRFRNIVHAKTGASDFHIRGLERYGWAWIEIIPFDLHGNTVGESAVSGGHPGIVNGQTVDLEGEEGSVEVRHGSLDFQLISGPQEGRQVVRFFLDIGRPDAGAVVEAAHFNHIASVTGAKGSEGESRVAVVELGYAVLNDNLLPHDRQGLRQSLGRYGHVVNRPFEVVFIPDPRGCSACAVVVERAFHFHHHAFP